MQRIQEALKAFDEGDVPVGAGYRERGKDHRPGYNRIEKCFDATAHAEILAIGSASDSLQSWRLEDALCMFTLEPCLMCVGAALQSRIGAIVYATADRAWAPWTLFFTGRKLNGPIGIFLRSIQGSCGMNAPRFSILFLKGSEKTKVIIFSADKKNRGKWTKRFDMDCLIFNLFNTGRYSCVSIITFRRLVVQAPLYQTSQSLSQSLERLSTGLRINRASDDAAGLGVSENLLTQVNGTAQASRNAQDGIAALNVAEGAR